MTSFLNTLMKLKPKASELDKYWNSKKTVYNAVNTEIQNADSFSQFKPKLKTFLLN